MSLCIFPPLTRATIADIDGGAYGIAHAVLRRRLSSRIDRVMTSCLPAIDLKNFSSDEMSRVEI
jgi:hypothetical protein